MYMDPQQQEAVKRACDTSARLVAITGQAGTGKTTILRIVYESLMAAGYSVALCAPTGKAARRIYEATGIPAKTIHKLLEYVMVGEPDPETGDVSKFSYPRRDRRRPLDEQVILVDEFAMVNHEVYRNLMDAIPSGGLVRAFGDINQLRPIEPNRAMEKHPTPFENLLTRFSGVRLETIHRQGEGSGIIEAANEILLGRVPRRRPDFTMKITEQPVKELRAHVIEMREKGIDYSTLEHQIITPTKQRWTGTHALNGMLQAIFRTENDGWVTLPRRKADKDFPIRVRVGDKIIWTVNNYDIERENGGLLNGETGIIVDTDEDDYGGLTIDFGDRIVYIPSLVVVQMQENGETVERAYDPRYAIDLAYALTTHKFQGSEARHVTFVMNKSTFYMNYRANFYTAVTRAREHVHLITDQKSLFSATRPKMT